MIDWSIVTKIWIGYGVNIIVLIILLLIVWAIGLVVQKSVKTAKTAAEDKESPKKG